MEKPYFFFEWNLQDKISRGRLHCCYYKGHNCVKYGKVVICLYVSQKNTSTMTHLINFMMNKVSSIVYIIPVFIFFHCPFLPLLEDIA